MTVVKYDIPHSRSLPLLFLSLPPLLLLLELSDDLSPPSHEAAATAM
jgi:hypothetical protein